MLGKIRKRINNLFKVNTTYCNKCRYYIPFNAELEDFDICGFTIHVKKDVVGKLKAEMDDNIQVCEDCGHVIKDNRKIKYLRCIQKNKDYKCADYKSRNMYNIVTDIRIKINNVLKWLREYINRNIMIAFICWAIFNIIFILRIIEYNHVLNIGYEILIPYFILTIIYFKYAVGIHKNN